MKTLRIPGRSLNNLSVLILILLTPGTGAGAEEVRIQLLHETMVMRIGYPAVILPGGKFPSVEITSPRGTTLEG